MHPLAARRIADLQLVAHPEGGHYREVFRSPANVQPLDRRSARAALTTIYYLLTEGEISRWHRVVSDEVWNFYEGDPLELVTVDLGSAAEPSGAATAEFGSIRRVRLGPLDQDAEPVCIVPAHAWQAARPLGNYTLAGCTVGPGFEFADFTLLRDDPEATAELRRRNPAYTAFL